MQLADIISLDRIECDLPCTSRKRALEKLGEIILRGSGAALTPHEVYEGLMARERLGSTAIGSGVAIPHGRMKNADTTLGALVQLHEGIDFDAMDKQPVDICFALLVPEHSTEEHLRLLAELAEMFSNAAFRERLRKAKSKQELYDLLLEFIPHPPA
jgi:nitrogen PTS system EIIA component